MKYDRCIIFQELMRSLQIQMHSSYLLQTIKHQLKSTMSWDIKSIPRNVPFSHMKPISESNQEHTTFCILRRTYLCFLSPFHTVLSGQPRYPRLRVMYPLNVENPVPGTEHVLSYVICCNMSLGARSMNASSKW